MIELLVVALSLPGVALTWALLRAPSIVSLSGGAVDSAPPVGDDWIGFF